MKTTLNPNAIPTNARFGRGGDDLALMVSDKVFYIKSMFPIEQTEIKLARSGRSRSCFSVCSESDGTSERVRRNRSGWRIVGHPRREVYSLSLCDDGYDEGFPYKYKVLQDGEVLTVDMLAQTFGNFQFKDTGFVLEGKFTNDSRFLDSANRGPVFSKFGFCILDRIMPFTLQATYGNRIGVCVK